LTLISDFILEEQIWIRLIGGLFLIVLGAKTFFSKPVELTVKLSHKTLINDFFATFLLTLTNPMTVIAYIAIFAGLGLTGLNNQFHNAFWLVFGVFCGSLFWWLILAEGVTLFRKRVTQNVMKWINCVAGSVIIAVGIGALLSLIVLLFIG
jgi:threonine/homoserine/homoserine lactone efflux protein